MAVSLGLFSSFFAGGTASLRQSPLVTVNLEPRGIMRIVAASESESATETKNREPRGIMKPRRVSPEMRLFPRRLSEIPRTRALKEIWAYIKQHDLQDPTDKKVIICDEKLKTIFGRRDRVGFLEITGLISPHFLK